MAVSRGIIVIFRHFYSIAEQKSLERSNENKFTCYVVLCALIHIGSKITHGFNNSLVSPSEAILEPA